MSLDLECAPTLDELLQGCIDAFDAQGKVRDPHLVRLVLTMLPWYLPPAEAAAKLLRTIEESGGSADAPTLRLKIGHLVRYWVRAFPGELAEDPELLGGLRALGGALGDTPPFGLDLDLESLRAPEGGSVPEQPPRAVASHKRSLLLEHLGPAELAAQLTHLEHRALAQVRGRDLRSFARRGGPAGSPPLQQLVALANAVSRWVQLLVLAPPAPLQRARVLGRCLHLAQSLLELRNFNSLMSVVGGLGHGSISRLRQTLALVPPELSQLWARLTETVSSAGNYRRYRAMLGGSGGGLGGFRLPALGVHLRDLVALEEALPDWGGPGRPHPDKLQRRFAIMGVLLGGGEPPVPAHPDLLHLLTVSLELGPSEDQLYQLSLEREPRERAPSGPPPELPPVSPLEKWVLPDPPRPDPELLRGHLERLVESLFQHFDVDGDGRISRAEFAIVQENFPQLQNFGELDTDGDGGLSRGEVLAFFQRCSQGPPPGPPHSFEPSRGLRPWGCHHCGGPILGLHKPGLKCRTCGLRCHTRCREQLLAECRRRTQSIAAETPPGPPGPPTRSFSFSLPRPRRGSLRTPSAPPPEPPPQLEELEDGVFDTHL